MNKLYLHRPQYFRLSRLFPLFLLFSTSLSAQVFLRLYDSIPENYSLDRYALVRQPAGFRIFEQRSTQIDEIVGFRYDTDENGWLQNTESVLFPAKLHGLTHVILSRSGDLITFVDLYLTKISFTGDTIWSTTLPYGWVPAGLKEAGDGTLYAFYEGLHLPLQQRGHHIYKVDPNGQVLSEFFIPYEDQFNFSYYDANLTLANDGGCMISFIADYPGTENDSLKSWRVAPDGNLMWVQTFRPGVLLNNQTIAANGNAIHALGPHVNAVNKINHSIWRVDQFGKAVQLINLDSLLPKSGDLGRGLFTPCQNGDIVYCNKFMDKSGVERFAMIRFTTVGQIRWLDFPDVFNNQPFAPPYITDGLELPDGALVFVGRWQNKSMLYKIRPDGTPTRITGTVAADQNVDCLVNAGELPLGKVWIEISDDQYTYLHRTDGQGRYHAKVDTGDYTVRVHPPSYLWEPCDSMLNVSLPDTGMTAVVDFPLQASADCPLMTIDVVSPFLHRCFSSIYFVRYCNNGTIAADSAQVVIDLDAGLVFDTSSIPVVINGQQLVFPLGQVLPGQCGSFQYRVIPDCNTVQLGETKCVTAHIYPDSVCGDPPPGWSGATVEVGVVCSGDSIIFTIYNMGNGPMNHPLEYVIIDDHVIMKNGTYWLTAGDSMIVVVQANGSPVRLIATQEPGHPLAQMPSIGIEHCGDIVPVVFSGFLNEFPNQNGSPFESTLCKEVVGSYDPNDKGALPTGFSSGHWIYPETELDYLIRFQNEGSFAALRVVVLDTLSAFLDPLSIRGETASHDFRMEMQAGNVLAFIFDGINLSSSKINEESSRGWVRFKAKPRAGLPDGTQIKNRAGIYFDFNEPVMTNTIFHRIGRRFWDIDSQQEPAGQTQRLHIWPNPATDLIYLDAGSPVLPGMYYKITDLLGRSLMEQTVTGSGVSLSCGHLPRGVYYLELRHEHGLIATGMFLRQ